MSAGSNVSNISVSFNCERLLPLQPQLQLCSANGDREDCLFVSGAFVSDSAVTVVRPAPLALGAYTARLLPGSVLCAAPNGTNALVEWNFTLVTAAVAQTNLTLPTEAVRR
jgi:hypothetical protein